MTGGAGYQPHAKIDLGKMHRGDDGDSFGMPSSKAVEAPSTSTSAAAAGAEEAGAAPARAAGSGSDDLPPAPRLPLAAGIATALFLLAGAASVFLSTAGGGF